MTISKFLLDYLVHFVGDVCYETNYRESKKQIYKGPSFDRIEYTTTFFDSANSSFSITSSNLFSNFTNSFMGLNSPNL